MTLLDEITRVVDESSHKLLQRACPPVRYYLLTDVMGRDYDDVLVTRTLEECRKYRPRIKLLDTLREDGTWPISKQRRKAEDEGDGPPYGWTYITILRNLYDLGEYQTTKEEGHVEAALERILSWQRKDGHIPGPWGKGIPLPHYNGFALRDLLKFGLDKDPRIQNLTRWLLSTQRSDGGWLLPYLEDMKYLPEYKSLRQEKFMEMVKDGKTIKYDPDDYKEVPSCIWTTMMVVRGLAHSYKLASSKEAKRGANFILDRFFKPNYHSVFYRSASNWTKMKFPTYFGSGLCALDIVTWLDFGANDPRMERPIKWLLSMRTNEGFWGQSERPHAEKDQWITEIALSILNRYGESIRGETYGWRAQMAKKGMKVC